MTHDDESPDRPRRIYLDNAATSWPKPEAVYAAVERYQRQLGAPVGRGVYREAVEVERQVAAARRGVARLLGCDDPRRVIFTPHCTGALNLALHGLLRPGDHVVTTVIEHNSVLRPLRAMETSGMIEVARVGCDGRGVVDPLDIRRALRPRTRLVAVSHASNVTGAVQDVAAIGAIAHEQGARLLVDAAQSAGHLSVDAIALGADLLAASGHKGLLGPLGTGFLYIAPGLKQELDSLLQGGTGTQSEHDRQPDTLPDKYEAGNLNVPGIVALAEGVAYVFGRGTQQIASHVAELTSRFRAGLEGIEGVRVYGPAGAGECVGVVSLTLDGYDPQELAASLDAAFGVQARPGLHCAPLMHRALGTLEGGGTLRFSFGPFSTMADVEAALSALTQIAASRPAPGRGR